LKQVKLIAYAKRAGFTLAQIRSVQENASLGKSPASLWRYLATRKAAELDQVIRAQQAKKRLVTLSQCRCRSLAKCGDFLQSSGGN
jgi:DNA-binding transcriptional MerR regulator